MPVDSSEAVAAFLRRIAPALTEIATAVTELASGFESTTVLSATEAIPAPPTRGPRQQAIVATLMACESDDGLKTGEIAAAVEMDQPNAYTTLQTLQNQGIVEMIPGVQPQRWRIAAKYRLGRRIVEFANLVREGEWTSYGEIGHAVYGHHNAGLAVARVMTTSSDVKAPHRVLEYTGHIADGWIGDGGGPEECRRRLESEGIEVSDDLFAHMRHRVGHEVLVERANEQL